MIQQDIKAASAANTSCLFIGQDRGGHWVVKDAHSLCGGLFANRNEAIRFAMYECQRRRADRPRPSERPAEAARGVVCAAESASARSALGATLPDRPRRTHILRLIPIHEPVTTAGYRQGSLSLRDSP
jgi:hypothetical protein